MKLSLNPYLTFDGHCQAAFEAYASCLGGSVQTLVRFGDMPGYGDGLPPALREKIMHARLVVGDQTLMGSDCTPEHPYEPIKGCSVAINVDQPAEAERIFHALAEAGGVQMPIAETDWAIRFGMLTDRFGVPWMVNCEKPV